MTNDQRIISLTNLERHKSVLVDAHSLHLLVNELKEQSVPVFDEAALDSRGGIRLANVIQNIVLYETIVVDSLLFDIDSDVSVACDLFPGIIKGLYVPSKARIKVGFIVDRIAGLDFVDQPPTGISKTDWSYWQNQDASEKQLMDELDREIPTVVPNDEKQLHHGSFRLPLCCTNSMMTLGRAHFYLELARELNIPLSADPIRSEYFKILSKRLNASLQKGAPERVLAFFEDRVFREAEQEYKDLVSIDLSIPPVAELVVSYAKKRNCSLRDGAMEIRQSKHAIKFREWCNRFSSLTGGGRAALKEQLEMADELKNVCQVWRKDVDEEVRYRTRKLNIEWIPIVGDVLKALNMQEVLEVRIPALMPAPKYSYLLFLNDLLRQPT